MEDEKLKDSDIKVTLSTPFGKWLSNFWYHHKWKVIIIGFFAIVIIVGVVQMLKKEDHDIEIVIATHTMLYAEDSEALEKALVSLMPEDFNGDGKKTLYLNTYKIYSEEELKAANEAETDSDGNPIIYADENFNKEQINEFDQYIMTGECTIMILSEYLYKDLITRSETVLLKPIKDIFGDSIPADMIAEGGYGILLYKTGAYKNLDALKLIPDDAVICMMQPMAFNKGFSEEKYEKALNYFKSIVNFGQ